MELLEGEVVSVAHDDLIFSWAKSNPNDPDPNTDFHGNVNGQLILTNFRLIFAKRTQTNTVSEERQIIEDVPLCFIDRVEKVGRRQSTSPQNIYSIQFTTRDMHSFKIISTKTNSVSRSSLYTEVCGYVFPASHDKPLFCFSCPSSLSKNLPSSGWNIYDPISDFKRMGVPNDSWVVSYANSNYELCSTYPRYLVVPRQSSTSQDLQLVASFRSRKRFPTLSWLNLESGVSLCRCAQPLVGVTGNRNTFDEKFIQVILDTNKHKNCTLSIMDARPKANGLANVLNGGGYESEEFYENCKFQFLGIANIHVMRESWNKLRHLLTSRKSTTHNEKWVEKLRATQWLTHIRRVLKSSVKIVTAMHDEKQSVLLHCSDGWDRTAQLSSLTMLLQDPFYRTIKGFETLIEKEWLSFGHKFSSRIGYGVDKPSDDQRSPVFLQFIDCVWQVSKQFPYYFEFNDAFLIFIMDCVYSCRFGTFLANCDKERRDLVTPSTESVWTVVNANVKPFVSPIYDEKVSSESVVIKPNTSALYIRLWTEYYCRHQFKFDGRKEKVQNGSHL